MTHLFRLAAAATLMLIHTAANPTIEDPKSSIDAPLTKIGKDLASWVQYFGDDYQIVNINTVKNPHNNDPVATFWLTDGLTTVRFSINLVTNDQYISEIESVSVDLLRHLETDDIPVDSNGNAELEHCWDAGCNRLRIHHEQNGHVGAVWSYYVD